MPQSENPAYRVNLVYGPFVGQFMHPEDIRTPHSHQHHSKPLREHSCDHCVYNQHQQHPIPNQHFGMMPSIQHPRPANHHPFINDEELIFQGVQPHHPYNRDPSYHSNIDGYDDRRRMGSFESLPDGHNVQERLLKERMDIGSHHPNFQPHYGNIRSRSYGQLPPQMPYNHYPQSYHNQNRPQPSPQYPHHQTPINHPPQQYHQFSQIPHPAHFHPNQAAPFVYNVPPSFVNEHMNGQFNQAQVPVQSAAAHHRSPSPSPEKQSKNKHLQADKEVSKKPESKKVSAATNLPIRLQRTISHRSGRDGRGVVAEVAGLASPLYNGPPPRDVYAYGGSIGLTPHPNNFQHVPFFNNNQPSWLRLESFGESPENNQDNDMEMGRTAGFASLVKQKQDRKSVV